MLAPPHWADYLCQCRPDGRWSVALLLRRGRIRNRRAKPPNADGGDGIPLARNRLPSRRKGNHKSTRAACYRFIPTDVTRGEEQSAMSGPGSALFPFEPPCCGTPGPCVQDRPHGSIVEQPCNDRSRAALSGFQMGIRRRGPQPQVLDGIAHREVIKALPIMPLQTERVVQLVIKK